jgi:hypothetical protein
MNNFLNRIASRFRSSPKSVANTTGLVATVISRTDTNTGKKQPISKTPTRLAPINEGAPVVRYLGMPDRSNEQ